MKPIFYILMQFDWKNSHDIIPVSVSAESTRAAYDLIDIFAFGLGVIFPNSISITFPSRHRSRTYNEGEWLELGSPALASRIRSQVNV